MGILKASANGAIGAVLLTGVWIPSAAAQPHDDCGAPSVLGTVTCVYDDPSVADYLLRIPAGVREVHVEARGAGGGNGGVIEPGDAPEGGRGGLVSADFPVAGGYVVRIQVGGRGEDARGMKPGAGGLGGGAGGGAGAPGGGGGGGASGVRLNGTDNLSRILMAGGGGGAGGAVTSTGLPDASGGDGGGDHGGNGGGDRVGKGGEGATGPSGGAGLTRITGRDGRSGYDETLGGGGGEGGYGTSNTMQHSGKWSGGPVGAGGGGGGYAGGSGGAAGTMLGGGGGGGSGFVATSALAPSVARIGSAKLSSGDADCIDHGRVVVTFQLPGDRQDPSEEDVSPIRPIVAATSERNG
ncbi:MAG: hypothetical protein ACT4QF_15660 [Sporichthyaceae bacterium]